MSRISGISARNRVYQRYALPYGCTWGTRRNHPVRPLLSRPSYLGHAPVHRPRLHHYHVPSYCTSIRVNCYPLSVSNRFCNCSRLSLSPWACNSSQEISSSFAITGAAGKTPLQSGGPAAKLQAPRPRPAPRPKPPPRPRPAPRLPLRPTPKAGLVEPGSSFPAQNPNPQPVLGPIPLGPVRSPRGIVSTPFLSKFFRNNSAQYFLQSQNSKNMCKEILRCVGVISGLTNDPLRPVLKS